MPVDLITSLTFGGPDNDILFVTTSRRYLNEQEKTKQPQAGSVFIITNLDARGPPIFYANL